MRATETIYDCFVFVCVHLHGKWSSSPLMRVTGVDFTIHTHTHTLSLAARPHKQSRPYKLVRYIKLLCRNALLCLVTENWNVCADASLWLATATRTMCMQHNLLRIHQPHTKFFMTQKTMKMMMSALSSGAGAGKVCKCVHVCMSSIQFITLRGFFCMCLRKRVAGY